MQHFRHSTQFVTNVFFSGPDSNCKWPQSRTWISLVDLNSKPSWRFWNSPRKNKLTKKSLVSEQCKLTKKSLAHNIIGWPNFSVNLGQLFNDLKTLADWKLVENWTGGLNSNKEKQTYYPSVVLIGQLFLFRPCTIMNAHQQRIVH